MVTTLQQTLSDRRFWIMFFLSTCILTPTIAIASHATGFAGTALYVDNTAPDVSIDSPTDGSKVRLEPSAPLNISWTITEKGSGLYWMALYINGNGQPPGKGDSDSVNNGVYSYSYSWSGWSSGETYSIAVNTTDNEGNRGIDTISVTTVADISVSKSWLNPSPGSWVSGTIDLGVRAYPKTSGYSPSDLAPIKFYVDGSKVGSDSSASDYDGDGNAQEWVLNYDTTPLSDGKHTVTAKFTDPEGDSHKVGVIMGAENRGGVDWFPTDPTTWLVSFGIALLGSLGIAYSTEQYTLRKQGK